MKLCILITTYNRQQPLELLLSDIRHYRQHYDLTVKVYIDGCTYSQMQWGDCIQAYQYEKNHGKQLYWSMIDDIFHDLRTESFDYILQFPDDIRLTPNAIPDAIIQFEAIDDPEKVCLNLKRDHRQQCWTGIESKKVQFRHMTLWKTGWVDMLYLANRQFFKTLDYHIDPILRSRWQKNPRLSSGVGAQISHRLVQAKKGLYQAAKSLIVQQDILSQMNFIERLYHPNNPL